MPTLQQRLVSAGPLDNDSYRRLTKVAKFNGHETAEEFLSAIVNDMLTSDKDDDGELRWETVAMRSEDHDFAVGRWGEAYRVMLDQTLADALDFERVTQR